MELCIRTTSQRPRVKIMTEEFFNIHISLNLQMVLLVNRESSEVSDNLCHTTFAFKQLC